MFEAEEEGKMEGTLLFLPEALVASIAEQWKEKEKLWWKEARKHKTLLMNDDHNVIRYISFMA